MCAKPAGTVTFLFTDLEDSTKLWEDHPEAMHAALARHDEILTAAIRAEGGAIVKTTGDGFHAAFDAPGAALAAALAVQAAFAAETWGSTGPLRVRMGIHTGEAAYRDGDYYGPTLNRAARLMSIGHGGQVLISSAVYQLLMDSSDTEILIKDLGQHSLRGLSRAEHIYQASRPGMPDTFPPLRSLTTHANHLPAQLTPFFGREEELGQLRDLILRPEVRIVSLLGPGGTGKTRLSIELAGSLQGHFADGVFFVPLAAISDPDLVPSTIAQELGVREGGGLPPLENLRAFLREKQILLVLDNLEQVIGCAVQIADMLRAAPGLKIAATSRVPLRITGEREFQVPTLPVPGQAGSPEEMLANDSVRLFVSAVQAVDPDFTLRPENTLVIVDICRRLDGLPLALEIAAARSKLLPLPEILERVDANLRILSRRERDLPPRQQTLHAAIEWSYDLLEAEEQRVFSRLGVFVGGFTLAAAEKVCDPEGAADILAALDILLDNSLIRRSAIETGAARFEMLLTIRDYALEKLAARGEEEAARRSHARYFSSKAGVFVERMFAAESTSVLNEIQADYGNYRAAMAWGLSQPGELAVASRIAYNIFWFWYRHGHFHEGRSWAEKILARTRENDISTIRAHSLSTAASMAMWQADLDQAHKLSAQSLEISYFLEDIQGIAFESMGMGVILLNQGRDEEARTHLEKSIELFREMDSTYFEAVTMVHQANVALALGAPDEASDWLARAAAIASQIGEPWLQAFAENNMGEVARVRGEYEVARSHYERTELLYKKADALGDQARLVHTMAYIEQHTGNLDRAEDLFRESLSQFVTLGNKRGIAECLAGLAGVAARRGAADWAAPLLAAGGEILTGSGAAWWPADRVEYERNLALIEAAIGNADRFNELLQQGRSFSLEDALAYVEAGEGRS